MEPNCRNSADREQRTAHAKTTVRAWLHVSSSLLQRFHFDLGNTGSAEHRRRQMKRVLVFAIIACIANIVMAQAQSVTTSGDEQLRLALRVGSVRLSDVEIHLVTEHGDGCQGRCLKYSVTIHGDGVVQLEDLGDPPEAEIQKRSIAADEVVAIVNRFLKARFFDALDLYDGVPSVRRKGDVLELLGSGGGTRPWVDITMRLGTAWKTVRLINNVPAELEALKDLVWQIGGPDAWPKK
jgi:hypothetical protein